MTEPNQGRIPLLSRACTAPAFTLIELLVTLTVLSLLALLTLQCARHARASARQIQCLANLRQWGIATQLYAIDQDDYLPREGSPNGTSTSQAWYVLLPRQLGIPTYHQNTWRTNPFAPIPRSLWICPSNTNRSNGLNLFHYSVNQHLDGTGADDRPTRLGSLDRAASLVWMFDNGRRAAVAQQNNVHTNAHSQGANFLFLDGHAQRFQNREYWEFPSNRGRTNNPSLRWQPAL